MVDVEPFTPAQQEVVDRLVGRARKQGRDAAPRAGMPDEVLRVLLVGLIDRVEQLEHRFAEATGASFTMKDNPLELGVSDVPPPSDADVPPELDELDEPDRERETW